MFDLETLPSLNDHDLAALQKADYIEASEIVNAAPQDVLRKLKYADIQQVNQIVQVLCQDVAPTSLSVGRLLEEEHHNWITTGDDGIDRLLGGGIRTGVITEVCGESASGKSHFGLQLCVAGQTPSNTDANPCGAILLTSERKVSFSRLEELARCINPSRIGQRSDKAYAKQLLDNVHTLHITEVDGLDHALAYIIPAMISRIGAADSRTGSLPIRLLVIDSIGALFRSSFEAGYSGLTQRSKMLCLIADKLKLLAQQQLLAVVVINQVTDVFSQNTTTLLPPRIDSPPPPLNVSNSASDDAHDANIEDEVPPASQDQPTMTYKRQSRYFSGQLQGYSKEASLGLVWANAVNVRIMLSRTGRRRLLDPDDLSRKKTRVTPYERERQHEEGLFNEETFEPTLIRRMHLVFSPFARQDLLDYVILQSGIHSVLRLHRSKHDQGTVPTVQDTTSLSKQSKGNGQPFDEDMVFDDLSDLPPEFWQDDQKSSTTT